jgi:hypothetical protein
VWKFDRLEPEILDRLDHLDKELKVHGLDDIAVCMIPIIMEIPLMAMGFYVHKVG